MTFEERARALAPLRLTDRQTWFLVTVALHGGFCLRRPYADFARLQHGENATEQLRFAPTSVSPSLPPPPVVAAHLYAEGGSACNDL